MVTAGGDELVVSFKPAGKGSYDVRLSGPAEVAFEGEWPASDRAAIHKAAATAGRG